VNPSFRLGTRPSDRRARVLNDFIDFASGTSSAQALNRFERNHEEDEAMKRTTIAVAMVLASALLGGVASASPKPGQDIQAPRTGNEDIQSPRGQQAIHDRNEEVQAPRG
jgi:hypothetical protein